MPRASMAPPIGISSGWWYSFQFRPVNISVERPNSVATAALTRIGIPLRSTMAAPMPACSKAISNRASSSRRRRWDCTTSSLATIAPEQEEEGRLQAVPSGELELVAWLSEEEVEPARSRHGGEEPDDAMTHGCQPDDHGPENQGGIGGGEGPVELGQQVRHDRRKDQRRHEQNETFGNSRSCAVDGGGLRHRPSRKRLAKSGASRDRWARNNVEPGTTNW